MFDDPPDLDLGDGHALWWVGWHPDRDRDPHIAHLPDVDRFGARIEHWTPSGLALCVPGGFVTFEQPAEYVDVVAGKPTWQVQSWEPLTVTPSVLCRLCGDHGWITEGRWVRA
jgi:hypothetical protein